MYTHHSKHELRSNCRLSLCVGAAYIVSGLLMMQIFPIYTLLITVAAVGQFYLAARAFLAYPQYGDVHIK